VAGHDTPVELEAGEGDFVVTPAMARLLLKLARERLEQGGSRAHKPAITGEDGA
jgi:hypothetical protein